jgi:hypothetical protein
MIADCSENQFMWPVWWKPWATGWYRVQVLLASVDNTPLGKVRPCDIHKLANSLTLRKVCGPGVPNECLRHLPRRPLVHLTHLVNHWLWLSHFRKCGKEAKIITLPKPSKDTKFPKNLCPISLLQKRKNHWSWVWRGFVPRRTDWR